MTRPRRSHAAGALALAAGIALFGPLCRAQEPARRPPAAVGIAPLAEADRREATRRLLSLLRDTDVGDGEAVYQAQQMGMALAHAVFVLGTPAEQDSVLRAAAALVRRLPTAGALASRDFLSDHIAAVELLSPTLTRARQRIGRLGFAVDGVALPGGPARTRRVFPIVAGDRIDVSSEIELQYAYMLSTIARLAAEHPLPAGHPAVDSRREALRVLYAFLLHDKVRFYWEEAPAWHWSGPFANMRERVRAKLAGTDRRVTSPPWFGAIIDHELHLFGVAADLRAAAFADREVAARLAPADLALLDDVRGTARAVMRQRVTGGRAGDGFLIDFGRWTSNPSYAYAGCTTVAPIPARPCPIDAVATDASHALRWPWWLESFAHAWPTGHEGRVAMQRYRERLARQLARDVLFFDGRGRPLLKNYMDGRNGWYRLREFPAHPWGNGPTSLTGSMRYGSWARLAPLEPRIAQAHVRFCEVLVSRDRDDVVFRTRYYGSPSTKVEMAGMGETDLYGPGSLYALTCRVNAALGLH